MPSREPRRRHVRDLMAAEMSNQLLAALGQRPTQSGAVPSGCANAGRGVATTVARR